MYCTVSDSEARVGSFCREMGWEVECFLFKKLFNQFLSSIERGFGI